jgi:predicted metalloprotease with PDZ domain
VSRFARVSGLGLALVLALAVALPALAGGKGEKCEHDAQECINKMAMMFKDRGWVGIEMDKEEGAENMHVTRVIPDSPAQAAGFEVGDVLLALNGTKFAEATDEQMKEAQKVMKVGATVTYTVQRGDSEVDLKPVLAQVPERVLAVWIGEHMLHYHVDMASAEKVEEKP